MYNEIQSLWSYHSCLFYSNQIDSDPAITDSLPLQHYIYHNHCYMQPAVLPTLTLNVLSSTLVVLKQLPMSPKY